jgi:tellurite resistance protein TehA-like permease
VRTAVVFWAIEAILLAGAIFLGALLYRKIRRRPQDQPIKPLNFILWALIGLALVGFFNLIGR